MDIRIVGKDWEYCYLHEEPKIKQQILKDLKKEVDSKWIYLEEGQIISIDRKDHSSAFEQFIVLKDDTSNNEIILAYYGGGS